MMKQKTKKLRSASSLLLVLAMVMGAVVALSLPVSATDLSSVVYSDKGKVIPPAETEVWDGSTVSEQLLGAGTFTDPYLIQSSNDLAYFHATAAALATAETHFKLTTDIYLNSESSEFEFASTPPNFAGVLDGAGYGIYNFYTFRGWGSTDLPPFFLNIVTGSIKNLDFYAPAVTGRNTTVGLINSASGNALLSDINVYNLKTSFGNNIGGLVTDLKSGVIEDCHVFGNINRDGDNGTVGGVVGTINSSNAAVVVIRNCSFSGTIASTTKIGTVGGIVGRILGTWSGGTYGTSVTIENCTVDGELSTLSNYNNYSALNYIGGIVAASGAFRNVTINNCVNRASVTMTGTKGVLTAAGGIVGVAMKDYSNETELKITNCANFGEVSSVTYAGGIVGKMTAPAISSVPALHINNSANYATVTAMTVGAEEDDTGTTAVDETLDGAGSGFIALATTASEISGSISTGTVTATLSGTVVGTGTEPAVATVYTLPENALELTDGTALAELNAYAEANGYRKWVAAVEPDYVALYVPTVIVANEAALTHQYNGEATDVIYVIQAEGTTVTVEWYDMASGTPLKIESAPSAIGTYRVVVTPSDDAGDIIQDDIVEIDFTISKADVTIVPDAGTYAVSGSTYTVTYDGEAHALTATVKSGTTGVTLNGAEPTITMTQNGTPATATEPGTYQVNFDYAGDSTYNAASLTVYLTVAKIQITYPANEWNVPTGGYNGTEQRVTLVMTADQEAILDVVYGGEYASTEVTTGTALTATATVSLKETAAAHYELTGTAPTYTKEWSISKGVVTLKLVDDNHNTVDTEGLIYDGIEKIYHIGVFNSNDTWLFNLTETITVLNAGSYTGTYDYAGENDNYEAVTALQVSFTVAAQSIEITLPLASYDKTYNGEAYTDADVQPTYDEQGKTWNAPVYKWEKKGAGDTYVTVTAAEVVNGGEYRLTVTVTDTTGNYAGKKVVTFTISRAPATLDIDGTGYEKNENTYTVTYNGAAKELVAITNSDGTPEVLYGGSATAPVDANTYAVTITLAQTDNYEAASITATLVIETAVVKLPEAESLWTYTDPYVYNGQDRTVNLNAAFLAEYGDLITVETGIGDAAPTQRNAGTWNSTFIVRLKSATNSKFSDETTGEKPLTCVWVINPAEVDLTGMVFADAEKPYTGEMQTLTATGVPSYISVQYTAGTTNVCERHAITATLTLSDIRNYKQLTDAQKTMTAYLTITTAQVTIRGAEGNLTEVTYEDGSVQSLTATAADGNGKDYTSSISVTITKNGEEVLADAVRDVGEYEFTFRLVDANATATPLKITLTIEKGTYPESCYRVTGETTVIADGKAHGLKINPSLGPDGEPIEVVEAPAEEYTDPGVYRLVFKLRGTDNYKDIDDVVCELTILRAEVKDEDKGITVEFGNGLDPALTFAVTEADKKGISTETIAKKTSLKALYSFALIDEDGKTVSPTTGITVRLDIPEKYLQDENLKIVKVTTKTDGSLEVKEMTKRSDSFTMSEDGTYCTFTVTDVSVSYGIVAGSSNIPQFVAIGAGAVALIAATAITVVRVVGHAKKAREDEE